MSLPTGHYAIGAGLRRAGGEGHAAIDTTGNPWGGLQSAK
jgi:hypothetical protein